MHHVHKCGGNNPWKRPSVCFRSQDTGCTCVHMDLLGDRGNTDGGRARKESSSQHAWDARLSFVARLLLFLCVGIHSDVLDLTFQGLIIWGTVMWKLACASPWPSLLYSTKAGTETSTHPIHQPCTCYDILRDDEKTMPSQSCYLCWEGNGQNGKDLWFGQRRGSIAMGRFPTLSRKKNVN